MKNGMDSRSLSDREEGFAIFIVLGFLAFFSVIILSWSVPVRQARQEIGREIAHARLSLMAEGMARAIAADVAATGVFSFNTFFLPSAVPFVCRHDDAKYVLTVSDTQGLLNVNLADTGQMARVFGGILDLTDREAMRLAEAVKDYRDPDTLTAEGFREDEVYGLAHPVHLPKNRPFRVVEELNQVLGMRREYLTALRPYVTVLSLRKSPDLASSPLALRYALTGQPVTSRRMMEEILQANRRIRLKAMRPYRLPSTSRTVEMRIYARDRQGTDYLLQAGMELSGRYPEGYRFVYWSPGKPTGLERRLAGLKNVPDCLFH